MAATTPITRVRLRRSCPIMITSLVISESIARWRVVRLGQKPGRSSAAWTKARGPYRCCENLTIALSNRGEKHERRSVWSAAFRGINASPPPGHYGSSFFASAAAKLHYLLINRAPKLLHIRRRSCGRNHIGDRHLLPG